MLTKRAIQHSNIWLALATMFLARGMSLAVATYNHFHAIPNAMTYSRLAASGVSLCVAVFHVCILPDMLRWFRTRKQELAMSTEILSEIDKANSLSSQLAGLNYDRAKGFLGDAA